VLAVSIHVGLPPSKGVRSVHLDIVWLVYATVAAAWIVLDQRLRSDRDVALRCSLWNDLLSGEIGLALSVWRHYPDDATKADRPR